MNNFFITNHNSNVNTILEIIMKKTADKKYKDVIDAYINEDSFKSDPNGSWTGRPEDPKEKPVQDVDDL